LAEYGKPKRRYLPIDLAMNKGTKSEDRGARRADCDQLCSFSTIPTSEPSSLRDFQQEALSSFLLSVPEKERRPVRLGIKRFLSFMQDTARFDWDKAEDMLDLVKQPRGI
jgi:hypothetical protein